MAEFTEEDDGYVYVRRAATHNAAHAVVAWLQGYRVRRVWLDDVVCGCDAVEVNCGFNGFARLVHSARAAERQCRVLLAGPVAESMFSTLPPESRLAMRDHYQVIELLRELCGEDAEPVAESLRQQTRELIANNSIEIALLAQTLLTCGSVEGRAFETIIGDQRKRSG